MKINLQKLRSIGLLLAGASFAGLILSGIYLNKDFSKLNSLNRLSGGFQTCYSRINQSFLSSMLGQQNTYTSDDFFVLTEECLSEVIASASVELENYDSTYKSLINSISNIVYSFHKQINGQSSLSGISKKFELIEEKSDLFLSKLSARKDIIVSRFSSSKVYFYVSMFVFFVLTVFWYKFLNKRSQGNKLVEVNAKSVLEQSDSNHLISANVEKIILDSLKINGLTNCASLFEAYHELLLNGKLNPYISNGQKVEQEQEETPQSLIDSSNDINLNHTFSKVFELFASKIKQEGVVVETQVEEGILVSLDEEILFQLIFSVLDSSMNSTLKSKYYRKLTIFVKKLGASVVVEVQDTGKGFDKDLIHCPINIAHSKNLLNKNLSLCYEFVSLLGGHMELSNHYENAAEDSGGSVKITLPRQVEDEASPSKKKTVVKGKKRDLLKSLQA